MTSTARRLDPKPSPRTSLEPRMSVLAQRLDEGYGRIEQAIQRGDDVERWESFWIDLLHEYEALHDELAAAA